MAHVKVSANTILMMFLRHFFKNLVLPWTTQKKNWYHLNMMEHQCQNEADVAKLFLCNFPPTTFGTVTIRGFSLVWICADKAEGLDNHLHIFKTQAELITCAQSLWCHLLKTGHVLSVHRVASSCCTVKAIWQFYRALWALYCKVSADD
jgi:hypothetical protein